MIVVRKVRTAAARKLVKQSLVALISSLAMATGSFAQLRDYEKDYVLQFFREDATDYAVAVRCARQSAGFSWKEAAAQKEAAVMSAELLKNAVDRNDIDKVWNEILESTKPSFLECFVLHAQWLDKLAKAVRQ